MQLSGFLRRQRPCGRTSQGVAALALLAACLRGLLPRGFLAAAGPRSGVAPCAAEASLRGVAAAADMLEADERALPQPAAHSGSMLVAGAASGLAALALVASRHRSQQRARVARGPGRIIDALFGKGTLDKMLGKFKESPSKTLTSGTSPAPAATPRSPPPGGEDPEDGDKLEKSLQRQEKQTVAIENMMGELQ